LRRGAGLFLPFFESVSNRTFFQLRTVAGACLPRGSILSRAPVLCCALSLSEPNLSFCSRKLRLNPSGESDRLSCFLATSTETPSPSALAMPHVLRPSDPNKTDPMMSDHAYFPRDDYSFLVDALGAPLRLDPSSLLVGPRVILPIGSEAEIPRFFCANRSGRCLQHAPLPLPFFFSPLRWPCGRFSLFLRAKTT